jgi:hypothetical protein
MPSPFPGMDPYLEGNEWQSFHVELSTAITHHLIPKLRPKYYARTIPRFITATLEIGIKKREVYPDIGVVLREPAPSWAGVETAVAPEPVQLITAVPTEIPHYVVEVVDRENQELVTSIEVLSPANKRGKGYSDYLDKRERILQSQVHLIEIDWLRYGRRIPMIDSLPDALYYVFLSRVKTRPIIDVWPIQLTSRLPTVPVPLLPGDEDVLMDLQMVFTTVYDTLDYGSVLNYTRPPEIALGGETAVIATTLLQQAGFRTINGP